MAKQSKSVISWLKLSWKFILVALLVVFAFYNMQNLKLDKKDIAIKTYLDQLLEAREEVLTIKAEEGSVSIGEAINSKPGDYYRLFFYLKATKNIRADSLTGESKVRVVLSGSGAESQFLPDISISQDGKPVLKDLVFRTNDRFSSIKFERSDPNFNPEIKISRVYVSRLNCSDDKCLQSLGKTVLGTENESVILPDISSSNDSLYKFGYKKSEFGQVFLAESNNLSAVNLSLDLVGSGGLGNYQVVLKKVAKEGDQFKIEPEILSSFYFEPFDLKKYFVDKNRYRFPMTYDTKPGEYYFIGIKNNQIKTNYFNSLKILGSFDTKSYSAGGAFTSSNKNIKDVGDMFLGVESLKPAAYNGQEILYNSIIEDIGLGQKLYRYKFSRTAADYLDIFEKSLVPASAPYLDNISGGITVPSNDLTSFTYKFDTREPFKNIHFKYKQNGEDYVNTLGYYSLDNQNWQRIPLLDAANAGDWFGQSIIGDGKSSVIYLKFAYDKDDIGKRNKLFGIVGLEVTGVTGKK